jgi:hypothetical protein
LPYHPLPLVKIEWGGLLWTGETLFNLLPARESPCKWPASSLSCLLAEVCQLAGILLAPAVWLKPFEVPPDANSGAVDRGRVHYGFSLVGNGRTDCFRQYISIHGGLICTESNSSRMFFV